MKTIEEAAKEYAENKSSSTIFQKAHIEDFKAGGEFAQHLIPVEEELPKSNIVDALNFFLCIVPIYDYPIVCKFLPITKEWYVPYNGTVVKPTFWRPIYFV